MMIYDIPAMVGTAFPRAMTPANILLGFIYKLLLMMDRHLVTNAENVNIQRRLSIDRHQTLVHRLGATQTWFKGAG